jgi:hypothetical protein
MQRPAKRLRMHDGIYSPRPGQNAGFGQPISIPSPSIDYTTGWNPRPYSHLNPPGCGLDRRAIHKIDGPTMAGRQEIVADRGDPTHQTQLYHDNEKVQDSGEQLSLMPQSRSGDIFNFGTPPSRWTQCIPGLSDCVPISLNSKLRK